MRTFYEFNELYVNKKVIPATLCYATKPVSMNTWMFADRVYNIKDNHKVFLKNRQQAESYQYISEEDTLALVLTAVLL